MDNAKVSGYHFKTIIVAGMRVTADSRRQGTLTLRAQGLLHRRVRPVLHLSDDEDHRCVQRASACIARTPFAAQPAPRPCRALCSQQPHHTAAASARGARLPGSALNSATWDNSARDIPSCAKPAAPRGLARPVSARVAGGYRAASAPPGVARRWRRDGGARANRVHRPISPPCHAFSRDASPSRGQAASTTRHAAQMRGAARVY